MKSFDLQANRASVDALAVVIAENESLQKSTESGNSTLKDGDVVTLLAGLPIVKTGEIGGETRTWLAFPATVKRGARTLSINIALNSLRRGYYAEKPEDVLRHSETTDRNYPSPELKMRFGALSVLDTTANGTTVPYVAVDQTITMSQIKGYRPKFESGEWFATDEEILIVAK